MSIISKLIKESILGKILYKVRDLYRFPGGLFLLRKIRKSGDAIILLGTPTFNNIGDHLIAESSIEFLKDVFPQKDIIEIPTQFFLKNKDRLQNVVNKESAIFIVGGGWMGNLWEDDEYRLQDMLLTFKEHKLVVLPQTVYYDFDLPNANRVLEDAKRVYNSCHNLLLFFRDMNSYKFALKEFKTDNNSIYLAPDIALYKEVSLNNNERNCVSICLRNDREKVKENNVVNTVVEYCKNNHYNYIINDTVVKHSIPKWKREHVINRKIKIFSHSSLVVTDRLHGMIFAVLTNCNCIAFDNKTKKVSGVYDLWLKKNKSIIFMDYFTEDKFYDKIDEIIRKNDSFNCKKELSDYFEKMKQEIKGE